MYTYNNLVELIIANKEIESCGITFIESDTDEVFVSYKDLYEDSLCVLYHLQSKGINPGDKIVIQTDNNRIFLNVFWACILGGIVPVPVTIGNTDEHKLKIFRICEVLGENYLFSDRKVFDALKEYARKENLSEQIAGMGLRKLLSEEITDLSKQGSVYMPQADGIAFIQFSSGSTGEPKGITLTHENLLVNIHAILKGINGCNQDVSLSWMPLTHDMGLIGFHLAPLYLQINHFIMPTALFVRRPVLWLKKAHQHGATVLSSPNFGYMYFLKNFNHESGAGWDLSKIRVVFNGAEPISEKLCREFTEAMSTYGLRRNVIFPVYGLAEACLAVTFPPLNEDLVTVTLDRDKLSIGQKVVEAQDGATFVDLGMPVDDCSVRICDENGAPIETDIIGHVQIKGKNVTQGYYNNPKATLKAVQTDGWFDTGDLGFMREDRLVVTGRFKDIIFINGQNYYPHDIERICETVEGMEIGKVAVCGVFGEDKQTDQIVIFVRHKGSLEEFVLLAIELKKCVNRQTGLDVKDVIPVRNIPKTTSSKTKRYKLIEDYQRGVFSEVAKELDLLVNQAAVKRNIHKPVNEVQRKLMEIWSGVLGRNDIGIEDNFLEAGGDSSMLIKFCAGIEKEFGEKVIITDLFSYPTVAKLANYIENGDVRHKDIQYKMLTLPEEYFKKEADEGSNAEQSGSTFRFHIKEETCKSLNALAGSYKTDLGTVLLSAFIYLAARVSGQMEITVQTVVGQQNLVHSMTVNLSDIGDNDVLLKRVKDKRNMDEKYIYCVDDISKVTMSKGQRSIIPFFYHEEFLTSGVNLLEVYDLIIGYQDMQDGVCVMFNYNAARLKGEKMEEFIGSLAKLINYAAYDFKQKIESHCLNA